MRVFSFRLLEMGEDSVAGSLRSEAGEERRRTWFCGVEAGFFPFSSSRRRRRAERATSAPPSILFRRGGRRRGEREGQEGRIRLARGRLR